MQVKMWGNEYRATLVCVDRYDDDVPRGRLYNRSRPEGESFHSLMDLFRKLEALLDDMRFPQSFAAVRSFRGPPDGARSGEQPETETQTGRLGTFSVKVLFRQNASWQGSVAWLEGEREESFRSALELAFLMDSALREG